MQQIAHFLLLNILKLAAMNQDKKCGGADAFEAAAFLLCANREIDNEQCCLKKGIGRSTMPPICINLCKSSVRQSSRNVRVHCLTDKPNIPAEHAIHELL